MSHTSTHIHLPHIMSTHTYIYTHHVYTHHVYTHTHTSIHMHIHCTNIHVHTYIHVHTKAGKKVRMFEPSFVCCAFESKFSLRSPAHFNVCACALVHSNVWLIMWACSGKVEAFLLAASASFLSPAMLNSSRNSDRNKISTHYKAIMQFWRFSIANPGESNIDKKY